MEHLAVGKRKKTKHTQSQPSLYRKQEPNNNLHSERKGDGLLNLSYISRIDETKETVSNPNINESREHYEQALVQLTTKTKNPKMNRNASVKAINSKNGLVNSKTSFLNKKMIDSVKDKKQFKFDSSNSCLNLPSMTSRSFNPHKSLIKSKVEKPSTENKTQRTQIYKFREKKQIQASMNVYSLPEVKYDPDTLHEMRIQNMIVYNEITCLLDKAKQLKEEQIGNIIFQLKNVTTDAQSSFNFRLEKLCGMIVQISKIILQEFSNDPSSIGIEDMSYLLDHKAVITNEIKACEDNFNVLTKVIKFMTDSREAYSIISNRNDRTSAKPGEVLKFLGITSRARFYCSEIIERIRLMERNSRIKKSINKTKQSEGIFNMHRFSQPNIDILEVDETEHNDNKEIANHSKSNVVLPKIVQADKSPDANLNSSLEADKLEEEKIKKK